MTFPFFTVGVETSVSLNTLCFNFWTIPASMLCGVSVESGALPEDLADTQYIPASELRTQAGTTRDTC